MKSLIYKSLSILACAVLFCITSCDEDTDYTPGKDVPEDCMSVSFVGVESSDGLDKENSLIVFTPEDTTVTNIVLTREVSDEAADVPINIIANDKQLSIGTTAHFDAGKDTATVEVNFASLPIKTVANVTVEVDPEYADPYTEKDGMTKMSFKIVVSEWIKACDYTNISFKDNLLPSQETELQQLDGINLFRIKNFLNSEIDLKFSIDGTFDADDLSKCNGYIIPKSNYEDFTQSNGYKAWYLISDAGLYSGLEFESVGKTYSWAYFWYSQNDVGYSTIDFAVSSKNTTFNEEKCDMSYGLMLFSFIDADYAYTTNYLYIEMYNKVEN